MQGPRFRGPFLLPRYIDYETGTRYTEVVTTSRKIAPMYHLCLTDARAMALEYFQEFQRANAVGAIPAQGRRADQALVIVSNYAFFIRRFTELRGASNGLL